MRSQESFRQVEVFDLFLFWEVDQVVCNAPEETNIGEGVAEILTFVV